MKGLINEHGVLHIERAGKMKAQLCRCIPMLKDDSNFALKRCGDHCPMFGEPVSGVVDGDDIPWMYLILCDGNSITFDQHGFKDQRPIDDEKETPDNSGGK